MARRTNASIMFTPLMRWERLTVPNSEGLAWIKTLSKDVKTSARTCLIKFDPGFRQGKTVSTWPVDSYVLEGEMTSGNRTYGPDTFHYRPAGVEFGPTETKKGITRVVFSSDEKHKASKKEVFHQDMKVVPWNKSYSDPTGLERGAKDLRQDDVAGYSLLLHSSFKPYLRNLVGVGHVHDHAEEAFVVHGKWEDYLFDLDAHIIWQPGLYVCRPPNESWHGDTTSIETPNLVIVRRGWVGETSKFNEKATEHSPSTPIQPINFVE